MSQAQRVVEDEILRTTPSVRLNLVEKSVCVWEAHLLADLPQGYCLTVALCGEKIIEAMTQKPGGMRLAFQFELSAECLSLRVTDPNGEAVLRDDGYLHLSNVWNRKYAHAQIGCETKTCHLCPYVVFMDNMQQFPD